MGKKKSSGTSIKPKPMNRLTGERVYELLKIRKMSQRGFAKAMDYSETFVSLMLKGIKGMKKEKILDAGRVLNVHPDVLTSPIKISPEDLLLHDRFLKILAHKKNSKNYPAIKTLIKSEDL